MSRRFGKARGLMGAMLLIPALLLAGCGAEATPTPVPVPTNTTAPATATTAMAAPTDTVAMAAPTNTVAMAAPTDTAAPAAPTDTTAPAAPTDTAAPAASGPTPGPTPVAAWTPGAHAGSISAPAKLKTAGTLTIGTDAGYPPQEYVDANGTAVGFDMDVAQELANRMGLKLAVVNFKFDDIIPALNAHQFDLVISAMTITPERQNVVDFVPYFDAGQSVLVAKGNPKNIKQLEDLSGLTAVAEQGTVEEQTLNDLNTKLAAAGKPKVNILTYPSDTDAVDQLRVGRADATLHDLPVAAYYATLNPAQFEVAIPNFDSAPEGIATAKDFTAMHDAVNQAITAMKQDGTMDAIMAKWGLK